MLPAFNSHKYIKRFTASGFNETQAEEIVELAMEMQQHNIDHLATKDDINRLEDRINALQGNIEQVEVGLRKDIESVKELMEVRFSSLKWVMPLLLLNFCAVVPALYGFIKSTIQVSGA